MIISHIVWLNTAKEEISTSTTLMVASLEGKVLPYLARYKHHNKTWYYSENNIPCRQDIGWFAHLPKNVSEDFDQRII